MFTRFFRRRSSRFFHVALIAAGFAAAAGGNLLAQEPGVRHLVINEMPGTSSPDRFIEIYNFGPDQNMNNWVLQYKTSANGVAVNYNFPAVFMLPRHALVLVHYATGSNTPTDLYTGVTPPFNNASGEIALLNGAVGVDFIKFGTPLVTPIRPADLPWIGPSINWPDPVNGIARQHDVNTRSSDDWFQPTPPADSVTPGQLNSKQVGSRLYTPILVNEFSKATGVIELYNPNSFPINVVGLQIRGGQLASDLTQCQLITLGVGTIAAGGFITQTLGGCTAGWGANNPGSIRLRDPAGNEWDAIGFNHGADLVMNNVNVHAFRKSDIPTGSLYEWVVDNLALNPGALNPGQQGVGVAPNNFRYDELGTVNATYSLANNTGVGMQMDLFRAVTFKEIRVRMNTNAANAEIALYRLTGGNWNRVGAAIPLLPMVNGTEQVYTTGLINVNFNSPGTMLAAVFTNGTGIFNTLQQVPSGERFSYGVATGVNSIAAFPAPAGPIAMTAVDSTRALNFYFWSQPASAVQPENPVLKPAEVNYPYSQIFNSPTGAPTLVWSGPTLPTGMTFTPGTQTLAGSGGGGAPTTPCVACSVQIRLTDGNGLIDDNTYTLEIYNELQWVTSSPLPDGEVNLTYLQTMSATGGPPPGYNWTVSTGPLAAGLSLSSAGTLSGLPSSAVVNQPFTLRVTDLIGNFKDRAFLHTIHPQLVITSGLLPGADQGSAYNTLLTYTGGKPGLLSWSIVGGSLPANVTLNPTTGQLAGTVSASPGLYNFTVQAIDSLGAIATKALSIQVFAPLSNNTAIMTDGEEHIAYSRTLTASGGNGVYSWTSQGGLPGFCTFSSAGVFNCPDPTTPTSVSFTARVTDTAGGLVDRLYTFQFVAAPVISTAALNNGEVNAAYNQTMTVTDGVPPYTWNGASLPPGLSISTAGVITGNPTSSGTFNGININVTDGLGGFTSKVFNNVVIYPQLQVSTPSLPATDQGNTYNFTVLSSGGAPGPRNWTIISGGPPAGISLDGPTGVLSGVVTAPPALYNFTIQVTDSYGAASRGFSIQVNPPVSITTPSLPDGEVSVGYSRSLTASGGSGTGYVWSVISGLPAGLSFSGAGLLSGSPTASGPVSLTVRVVDSLGGSASRLYNFNIYPSVLIVTASLPDGEVNLLYSQTLTASGGGGAGYTWSVLSGLPSGLSLSPAGLLSGTPTSPTTASLNVQVADSLGGIASRLFNFTIHPIVTVTTASLPNGEVNLAYNQTLLAGGGTGVGYSWSVVSGLPPGLTLSPAGLLSGTPTASGPANLTIQVMDSLGGTASRLFNFTIYSALSIVTPSLPVGEEGISYSQTLTATGGSGGYNWAPFSGLPTFCTLGAGSGLLSCPNPTQGPVTLTVRLTDSLGGQFDRLFNFSFVAAPTITTATLNTGEVNAPYNQTMAVTGGAPPYTWSGASLPPGLSISAAGVITGMPTAAGTYNGITITVNDGPGGTAQKVFNGVVIVPAVRITTPPGPLGPAEVNIPFSTVSLTWSDGQGSVTFSLDSGSLPAGITLSVDGSIAGTPTVAGGYSFIIRITDALGGTDLETFNINVSVQPIIVNTSLPKGVVQVAYPGINLLAQGGVPPYNYSYTGTLPTGITFSTGVGGGQFGGTPTTVGGGPITFRVTDSLGGFFDKLLGIQVIDPPLPTDWSRRAQFSGGVGQIVLAPGYHSVNKPVAYVTADQGGELFRTVDRGSTWQSFLVDNNNSGAPIHTLRMSSNFAYNTGTGIFSGSLFVSTGAGGVYQSSDGGATFASRNFGLPNLLSPVGPKTSALAISPNFAGDTTAWVVVQVGAQTKLYRTTMQPENWGEIFTFPAGLAPGAAQLEASPNFAVDNTLFAVYDGKIYRSTSGGTSWSQVYDPLTGKITHLVFSPNYAAFPAIFAENESRVFYRSLDGGATWEQLAIQGYNLAFGDNGAGQIALYFKAPGGTYALVKSEDRGTTFVPVYARGMQPAGPTTGQTTGPAFHSVLAVGGLSGDIFSGSQAGLTVSNDGGSVFFPRQTGLATIKATSISGRGDFVVAATDGGILRSRDAGLTWIQIQNLKLSDNSVIQLPNTSLAAVSPAFNLDRTFFVNVTPNFSGPQGGLYRTTDGGFTFTLVMYGGQCRTMVFVPGFDARIGQPVRTLYAGCFGGLFRSVDGGETFMALSGASGMDPRCNQSTRTETDGLGLSPRLSPPGSYTLFRSGDGGICVSNDSGVNWSILLGGGNAPYIGTISSAPTSADSPTGVDRLSIRTDFITYQIAYSTDGGLIWSCVRTPSLTCLQGIVYARAFFSPNYATDRLALIAVNRTFNGATGNAQGGLYRFDASTGIATPLSGADLLRGRIITGIYMPSTFNGNSGTGVALVTTQGGGLYRSIDSANTFQPITRYDFASSKVRGMTRADGGALGLAGGMPAPHVPFTISSGTLLSASDDGVYTSDDGGLTFDDISLGLPDSTTVLSIATPSLAVTTPVSGVTDLGLYKYNGTQWNQDATYNDGNYVNFIEDGSYLYAVRADGYSLRGNLTGSGWTALTDGGTDLQNIAYSNATTFENGPLPQTYGPHLPNGTTASLWGVSASAGPKYSLTSGTSWIASTGGNDYILPTVSNYQVITALGLDSVSGARVALVGYNGGLYRTTDGGDTWRSVTISGSGLEATSKNATAMISAATSFGTTDVLVGMSGTSTNGGVYLSGDAGEHWTQINSGFDSATLNITSLVKTSCTGCPVQYYSGTYGSGVYTRTITVSNPPAIPATNYACWTGTTCSCATNAGSGPEEGGQAFKLCGTGFLAGAVVEFDGIAAIGCSISGSTVITCTGTPPHFAGAARVRVRNTDTRAGYLTSTYTYTSSAPRVGNTLTVAKSGSSAILSWTSCTGCDSAHPARIYRSQNAAFTTYLEQYNTTALTYTNTSAASSAYSYFWNVE